MVAGHEIASMLTSTAPAGFGNEVSVHVVPFQRNPYGVAFPGETTRFPVAKQNVGPTHETPVR